MQVIAVRGMRRYGFHEAANRISMSFLRLLLSDFAEHGTLKEKYDVEAGRSAVAADLRFGYTSNEVGFGWTNAAFLQLAAGLPPDAFTPPMAGRRP
jgi:alpha,alpha-trehalase